MIWTFVFGSHSWVNIQAIIHHKLIYSRSTMPVEISVTEEINRVPFIFHIPNDQNFTSLVGDLYQLRLKIKKSIGSSRKRLTLTIMKHGRVENEEYEDFCRTKLMLHHPFDRPEDLTEVDPETGISSYSYAFRRCAELHQHPRDPLDRLDGEDEGIDDDLEDADEQPDPGSQPAFAELAARTGRDDRGMDEDNADLGTRPIDQMYDWHATAIQEYLKITRVLPSFNNTDWNQLRQIRTILAEFDRYTLKLSTDIPQISQSLVIYYQLFDLLQVVQDKEGKFRDFDVDIANAAKGAMKKYDKYYTYG